MSEREKDDDALWALFTKGMEKLPRPPDLPGEQPPARARPACKASPAPPEAPESAVQPLSVSPTQGQPRKFPGTELDRRTEERFLSGKLPIEGRIDLHGMTQEQAHRALSFFLAESLERGRRMLLVITGKGRGGALASETAPEDWIAPAPGILRQNMPRWLEAPDIRPHILKIAPAQPRHGGSGAFYIYLRRVREKSI